VEIKEDKIYLSGHVAKANELTTAITNSLAVTVVFREPHAYISSSWYDHVNVPTWNYIAVHMKGQFRLLEGESLIASISKMVEHYEAGRPERFEMEHMSSEYFAAHLQGLTGFEIEVVGIEANYKLSQNRNDKNYQEVVKQLLQYDQIWDKEIATEMLNLSPHINEG